MLRLGAAFFTVIILGPASPDPVQSEADSLKGLPGVFLIVQGLSAEVEADGLTAAAIQADVEAKLRLAGIRGLPREQAVEAGYPYVYVNVDAIRNPLLPLYAYNVRLELFQAVQSVLEPRARFLAITWQRTRVGSVGAKNLQDVRDEIKQFVDEFVKDWFNANPR